MAPVGYQYDLLMCGNIHSCFDLRVGRIDRLQITPCLLKKMYIKFYIFLSLFSTKRNCSATVSSAGLLSFNIRTEIEIVCAFLQETLHKHNEDTVDNSVETVEESLAGTDTEENGGGGCLKLFTNWPLMSSITLYCIFSLQDVAYAEVKLQLVC